MDINVKSVEVQNKNVKTQIHSIRWGTHDSAEIFKKHLGISTVTLI